MKTIAIDFDGVIHEYSQGWKDGSIYDQPVPYAFEAIQDLIGRGYSVIILSTRKPRQVKRWIDGYIMESEYWGYGLGDPHWYNYSKYGYTCRVIPFWKKFWDKKNVVGITNRKLPAMVYVDDRGLKFEGDWIKTVSDIASFKTYQK